MTKEHKRITAGMSERERFRALRGRRLVLVSADRKRVADEHPDVFECLSGDRREAKPILIGLAEEFGVFKSYRNDDLGLDIEFSKNNMHESISKQKGRFGDFCLMLSIFESIVKNAVVIEAHKDKYGDTNNLNCMYVLASAFVSDNRIIPIKLDVKELKHPKQNGLYVVVSESPYEMAKATFSRLFNTTVVASTDPQVASSISIRRFFRNVNTLDKDFIKYIPDGFLRGVQRRAKRTALKDEARYVANKIAFRSKTKNKNVKCQTKFHSGEFR